MNLRLPFRTATFILLSLSILLALTAFLLLSFRDTRAIVSQQVEQHSASLAARFEHELNTYLDLVEENVLTIRSNEALISTFYVQDEAGFLQTLSAWEEDYERGRYDFLAVRFPQRQRCFLFPGYFTGLDDMPCNALLDKSLSEGFDWKIVEIAGETLAVFSSPLYLNSSGKMIGHLVAGVKLSHSSYLLHLLVDRREPVRRIALLHNDVVLSELSQNNNTLNASYRNPAVTSSGRTVLGPTVALSIESADNSIAELRSRLLDTFIYGGLITLALVSILTLLLSRSLDAQLQSLIGFIRGAHRDPAANWQQTHIQEFNAIGHQMIEIVRDLQSQKELLRRNNEDKRRILHHLIETEERERIKLSNDLHDDIGQLLAALKTNLYFMRDEHKAVGLDNRSLKTSLDIVGLMYDAIYHRIGLLRSSEEMQHFGLAGSLPLITVIPQLENLDYAVELDIRQSLPLRKEIMVNLYRIAQEALTNVLKYASGTWVLVRLVDESDGLRMQIQDDGVGLRDEKSHKKGGGFGFISMRERTDQIGGEILIQNDDGVLIDIFVPAENAYLQSGESNEFMGYLANERTLPKDL